MVELCLKLGNCRLLRHFHAPNSPNLVMSLPSLASPFLVRFLLHRRLLLQPRNWSNPDGFLLHFGLPCTTVSAPPTLVSLRTSFSPILVTISAVSGLSWWSRLRGRRFWFLFHRSASSTSPSSSSFILHPPLSHFHASNWSPRLPWTLSTPLFCSVRNWVVVGASRRDRRLRLLPQPVVPL